MLRLISYLAPSIPADLFRLIANDLEATCGLGASPSSTKPFLARSKATTSHSLRHAPTLVSCAPRRIDGCATLGHAWSSFFRSPYRPILGPTDSRFTSRRSLCPAN